MTVEPISDERLAEIRAGLEKYPWDLEELAGYGVVMLADLLALLARLNKAEAGWQDISTAPKDGTWVELYRPPADFGWWECLIKARWHQFEDGEAAWAWPDEDYDLTTESERERSIGLIEDGNNYEATEGFTHWRPLPPNPSA